MKPLNIDVDILTHLQTMLKNGWWVTFDHNLESGQFCAILYHVTQDEKGMDCIHEEADTLEGAYWQAVRYM